MPRKPRLFIPEQPVHVEKRYVSYQSLLQDELDRQTLTQITRGIEKGKAVGDPEFLLKVAEMRNRGRGQD